MDTMEVRTDGLNANTTGSTLHILVIYLFIYSPVSGKKAESREATLGNWDFVPWSCYLQIKIMLYY